MVYCFEIIARKLAGLLVETFKKDLYHDTYWTTRSVSPGLSSSVNLWNYCERFDALIFAQSYHVPKRNYNGRQDKNLWYLNMTSLTKPLWKNVRQNTLSAAVNKLEEFKKICWIILPKQSIKTKKSTHLDFFMILPLLTSISMSKTILMILFKNSHVAINTHGVDA